jgi:hypothetical protein
MSRNDELVAVVTGGSRGIGKGVARALAERGATVYIAGRSQAGGIHTSPGGALLPGTIQEAVEEVNSLGGRGIAVACDLSVDEEIRSLFERVRQESGHLNILVNNAAYHVKAIIACDFFIVVTTTFRLVHVFVIMEVGSRKILHFNTTCHPTADWTLQQFRECVTGAEPYTYVIHDRDSIYSKDLDSSLRLLGLRVLRTPYRSPQANCFCERLIGSARRECLDFMIPLNESHIRIILKPWIVHYNRGRPHRVWDQGYQNHPCRRSHLGYKWGTIGAT